MTVVLLTKAADTATLPNKQSNRLVRSYPFPCTTTRVPPPTEPEAGITFIMATASSYVNKTPSSVKSWPLLLSSTVTELVPAAIAIGVVHVTVLESTRTAGDGIAPNRHMKTSDVGKFVPLTTTSVPPFDAPRGG